MTQSHVDRVGIGWRNELAPGILANLDHIDILEILAEDYVHNPRRLNILRRLAPQCPLTLHGVTMGLASTVPIDARRIDTMARVVNTLKPESWSEHLAFVRGGGIEIGHLATPPRTVQSIEGSIANIERARRVIGDAPLLENIATLIDPPASSIDEPEWISSISCGGDAQLLLDLHNLYANAVNFGEDPEVLLLRFPLHAVSTVHVSGGHWIPEPGAALPQRMRLLDDHVHDVPDPVFRLLTLLAQHTKQALTVILERDGKYPAFEDLLLQLEAIREALRRGRNSQSPQNPSA